MLPVAELFPNLLPTALVALGALATLAFEPFFARDRKHVVLPWIAFAFLALAMVSLIKVTSGVAFGILAMDHARMLLLGTLLLCGLLGIAGLSTQLSRSRFPGGEAYSLMMLSLAGSMIMVQSTDLLALFVGMELSAIPVYALVGMRRKSLESNEGIFKYFVFGALFGAVFLYGAALWYGSTGSTAMFATLLPGQGTLQLLGFSLVCIALFFKAGAAPLHFWVADTYTGASIPVTSFMSTTVKIGAIAGIGAFWLQAGNPGAALDLSLPSGITSSIPMSVLTAIVAVGLASIIIGAFSGLGQTRARRLMAFSAVANGGYLILALLIPGSAGLSIGLQPLWFYLIVYALASSLVLTALAGLVGTEDDDDTLSQLKGLARKHPYFGTAITFGLLSLAGLPPAVGFIAKFGILAGLFSSGMIWTSAFALVLAVTSVIYYFRMAGILWQTNEEDSGSQARCACSAILIVAITLCFAALVALSVVPSLLS